MLVGRVLHPLDYAISRHDKAGSLLCSIFLNINATFLELNLRDWGVKSGLRRAGLLEPELVGRSEAWAYYGLKCIFVSARLAKLNLACLFLKFLSPFLLLFPLKIKLSFFLSYVRVQWGICIKIKQLKQNQYELTYSRWCICEWYFLETLKYTYRLYHAIKL